MTPPGSPDAAILAEMSWVLVIGAAAIFLGILGLVAYALAARRDQAAALTGNAFIVGGGIVFPVVALSVLLVYSLVRAASLSVTGPDAALRVEVTGEQWWWRVRYLDAGGRVDFVTANEIHIPAGRAVDLTLKSADVLHSFWVPELAGKLDMIPGRVNRLRISASRPGTYRGQCAEYCGGPHGFMAFAVVALDDAAFEQWAARQREPAAASSGTHARGAALFAEACAACHTVRGTRAEGARGPDLTHVAGRGTLGAGRIAMSEAALAEWVAHNQRLKPGNLMPSFAHLQREDLAALAGYMATLE